MSIVGKPVVIPKLDGQTAAKIVDRIAADTAARRQAAKERKEAKRAAKTPPRDADPKP